MSFARRIACLLAPVAALSACTSVDSVLFTTKTSLGVDFDSKPATANIAYDRVEGYFAPRYRNGALPAAVASIQSDAAIFNPKVRQVYATGTAAEILASKNGASVTPGNNVLERGSGDERELVFFGTTNTLGMKVGFTGNLPDSFTFGFKRKEFSLIPLATTTEPGGRKRDIYPAVLASVDATGSTGGSAETGPRASVSFGQTFATGRAAESLAGDDDKGLRDYLIQRLKDPIGDQEAQIATLLACYASVRASDRTIVWDDAERRRLLAPGRRAKLAKLRSDSEAATAAADERETLLRRANSQYAGDMRLTDESDQSRPRRLNAHSNLVCGLSNAGLRSSGG